MVKTKIMKIFTNDALPNVPFPLITSQTRNVIVSLFVPPGWSVCPRLFNYDNCLISVKKRNVLISL